MNAHLYIYDLLYTYLLESGFTSWALEVIQKDYMHVCMGSPVYDEEAEADHRCLIILNVMCLAKIAKCKTLAEPCCLKIGGS